MIIFHLTFRPVVYRLWRVRPDFKWGEGLDPISQSVFVLQLNLKNKLIHDRPQNIRRAMDVYCTAIVADMNDNAYNLETRSEKKDRRRGIKLSAPREAHTESAALQQ